MRDHDAIFSRWSLPWNLLSKLPRLRSEASRGLPVFSSRRRAKQRSVGTSQFLQPSWILTVGGLFVTHVETSKTVSSYYVFF